VESSQIKLRNESHPDVAITRVLLAACAIFENDIPTAQKTIKKALAVLEIERGSRHQFTLAAQGYAAWLGEAGGAASEIASRIRSELSWQEGSDGLAAAVESGVGRFPVKKVPVVL
jgi:hypothetical protein